MRRKRYLKKWETKVKKKKNLNKVNSIEKNSTTKRDLQRKLISKILNRRQQIDKIFSTYVPETLSQSKKEKKLRCKTTDNKTAY